MPAKKIKREHLMEKKTDDSGGCGFNKEGDRYYISRTRSAPMQDIIEEEGALNSYVHVLNTFVADRYKTLSKRKAEWWKKIMAGMELSPDVNWTYDPYQECVHPAQKPEVPNDTK